jgi:peptidylprolyl isomerase
MNIFLKRNLIISLLFILISCNNTNGNEDTIVIVKTSLGEFKIKLYNETPVHRDNFIKLIRSGFYDGISFHRVIKNFMVQAGDPLTKNQKLSSIADTLNGFTIPAEILPRFYHKKGALAAARQGNEINPEMRSSGTQFYIVQGVKLTDAELNQAEQRINNNFKQSLFNKLLKQTTDSIRLSGKSITDGAIQEIASVKMFQYLSQNKEYKITEDQRQVYRTIGGTPRLDSSYTVFGEIIDGLDVIDKIAAVPTDNKDKPLNDIKILKIKILPQ